MGTKTAPVQKSKSNPQRPAPRPTTNSKGNKVGR